MVGLFVEWSRLCNFLFFLCVCLCMFLSVCN